MKQYTNNEKRGPLPHSQADAAVHESVEHLQLFVTHAPVAIAMFDRSMRYLAVSNRWQIEYGLGIQSLVGRSHYEIFPELPEDWKAIRQRATHGTGLGLGGMEKRLRVVGGQLDIRSAPGQGTEIRAWVPMRAAGE